MNKFLKNKIKKVIPTKMFLKYKYKKIFNKKLDLKNPKSFNEKLNWLKVYDKNPLYIKLVDKYEVKKYVEEMIGKEYVIPTFGIWDSFEKINFDELPNQFVLKCTHDSGGLVIVKNKKILDMNFARNKIEEALKNNYYYESREWPYKNVKPRIIAEEYMEDEATQELRDYKFFCFDGKVKFMFIASNRQGEGATYFDFYTLHFEKINVKNGHPNAPYKIEKPINFEKMIKLSERLSKGIKHVRVDWYEINGRIYFGEMTFYHNGGFVPFVPNEWDDEFGKYLKV